MIPKEQNTKEAPMASELKKMMHKPLHEITDISKLKKVEDNIYEYDGDDMNEPMRFKKDFLERRLTRAKAMVDFTIKKRDNLQKIMDNLPE